MYLKRGLQKKENLDLWLANKSKRKKKMGFKREAFIAHNIASVEVRREKPFWITFGKHLSITPS